MGYEIFFVRLYLNGNTLRLGILQLDSGRSVVHTAFCDKTDPIMKIVILY